MKVDVITLLALIFALLILIKLAIIALSPSTWAKITSPLWKNNTLSLMIYLILALVVGSFVLQEISIIQVAAVFLLAFLLIGAGFISYPKALFALKREVEKESGVKILRENWLTVLIWAGFAVWVIIAAL